MKSAYAPDVRTTRRTLPLACTTALAVALTLPQPAHADDVTPPPVPFDIEVPAGNGAFLVGHLVPWAKDYWLALHPFRPTDA